LLSLGNRFFTVAQFHRELRNVTEAEFIAQSKQETSCLDVHSMEMLDLLHIKGAVNPNFADINEDCLAKTLPDKKPADPDLLQ
jgi:hypothetical protein